MALREVKPLNDQQWGTLVYTLNKKPTLQQTQIIKKAIENAKKLKVIQ